MSSNNGKVTMKIEESVHRKLQIVKGMTGAKNFSKVLEMLAAEYIEARTRR